MSRHEGGPHRPAAAGAVVLAPGPRACCEPLDSSVRLARQVLEGRVVWNVNATATGGGVAEMLQTVLAYGRGAGSTPGGWCWRAPAFFRSPSACTTVARLPR